MRLLTLQSHFPITKDDWRQIWMIKWSDLTCVRAEVVDISIPLYLSTSLPPLTAHIHHHTATR